MPKEHQLDPGDCLQSLALANGFGDGKKIYDAPENADLRKLRAVPAAVAPGDTVVIPDLKPRTLSLPNEQVHNLVVRRPKAVLRVVVCDEAGEPIAGKSYELTLGETTIQGTTTGDGVVEQPLPLDVTEATLLVHEESSKDQGRWRWHLTMATLEGSDTPRGQWQRLVNLGYWCEPDSSDDDGEADADEDSGGDDAAASGDEGDDGGGDAEDGDEDGDEDDADEPPMDSFALAVRAFQHDEGLDESGEIDDDTLDSLIKRHGI